MSILYPFILRFDHKDGVLGMGRKSGGSQLPRRAMPVAEMLFRLVSK